MITEMLNLAYIILKVLFFIIQDKGRVNLVACLPQCHKLQPRWLPLLLLRRFRKHAVPKIQHQLKLAGKQIATMNWEQRWYPLLRRFLIFLEMSLLARVWTIRYIFGLSDVSGSLLENRINYFLFWVLFN